jgi:hypothetical protein
VGKVHASLVFGLLGLGLAALLLLACEGGFQAGRRTAAREHPKAFDNAMNWQGAVLGLAGLLIGFTFAMAVTRFDSRRHVLIAEASAVETFDYRTQLLDESVRTELRSLIRRYVDLRIALYDVSVDARRAEVLERSSAELQTQIWARVVAVARADPRSITAALVVQSATEMFERAAERRATREIPVPPTVFIVVILASAIAIASIGYTLGLGGTRMTFGMFVIPLLVAGVIMLVIDIAHPSLGIVRIPDLPMLHLRESL